MHAMTLWISLITLLSFIYSAHAVFTCQGSSDTGALNNCPDRGYQKMSAGGNVTILVFRAENLPNKDNSGPAAMVSDPYVRFTVGSVSVTTSAISNSLNPHWGEYVSLGFLGSSTEITVEIWDEDTGVEMADDLLGRTTFRVPFCSTLTNYSAVKTVTCDDPFDCRADDSLWHMPTRRVCNETGFVNFNPSAHSCASGLGTCLYFEVHIVPFQMDVEVTYSNALVRRPVLGVLGERDTTGRAPWTGLFGRPFLDLTTIALRARAPDLNGALMFRTANTDKGYGAHNAINFYAALNFPATVYICRFQDDNAKGVPSWITDEYTSRYLTIDTLLYISEGSSFGCFSKEVSGTRKNEWGGVESGAVAFRTNTLPGLDSNTNQNYYRFNYIILAVPTVSAPREDKVSIIYDMSAFLNVIGSYGLIWGWFVFLVTRFLKKIDYRIDRLSNYLATRVLTGEDRSVLAGLFLNNGASPCNVEFRSHLYHAKNVLVFIIFLPFGLLMSWGIVCAITLAPPALGIAMTFIGSSLLCLWYGLRLWERSLWRMSSLVVASLSASFCCFVLFFIIALFMDPGVLHYGYALDIAGLSLIFATMNCVPCILLIFKHDRSQSLYLELVVNKISDAVHAIKNPGNPIPSAKDLQINRVLHGLLGDKYSINPKLPALKYAAVMDEIKLSFNTVMTNMPDSPTSEEDDDESMLQTLLTEERKLYGSSLFILFVYFVIAASTTASPSLAFLNICALILLDVVHLSMSKGDNAWSPGFKTLLLILGRMLICGSPVSLWMLNYSACYMLYSITLIHELIQGILPTISARKAGEIVFGGGESLNLIKDLLRTSDLSGGPAFSLGLLSLSFLAILIIASYIANGDTTATTQLLVPTLNVWGSPWPVYVFGLIAFLTTVVVGLLMATKRAYELERHGLLQGWARETYLFRKDLKLPFILALASEGSIVLSGLLIYAVTKAAAVVVGAIYIPAILLCLGIAHGSWRKNDFVLVHWPRLAPVVVEDIRPETSDGGSSPLRIKSRGDPNAVGDMEEAFNMIENLFGAHDSNNINNMSGAPKRISNSPWTNNSNKHPLLQTFDERVDDFEPETEESAAAPSVPKTLKGFALPAMQVTGNKVEKEIKMPPLPLKSVLRRKRANMGIKIQSNVPLVTDLRVRDGATSADQFGNKQDVFDMNDPWAQFEMTAEEEVQMRRNKKKGTVIKAPKAQSGLYKKLKKNSWLNSIYYTVAGWGTMLSNVKVYPTSYQPNLMDDEEVAGGQIELYEPDVDLEAGEGTEGNATSNKMSAKSSKSKKLTTGPVTPTDTRPASALDDDFVDISKMSLNEAFFLGYLTNSEYTALLSWYTGLFLIMIFGITLGIVVTPSYIGYIIWVACWLALFVGIPVVRYFNIYKWDTTSKRLLTAAALTHFMFCILFFGVQLKGDIGSTATLWIFDFFIYFPVFGYIFFTALEWVDSGFKMSIIDKNQDGSISFIEVLQFMQTFPALVVMVVLFIWQLYIWINITVGLVATLMLIVGVLAYIYIKDWADNDSFLSPELASLARFMIHFTMFISFCVGVFRENNPIFALSVFLFAWIAKYLMALTGRLMMLEKESVFYFAPCLFPIYSYDSSQQDVNEENDTMKHFLYVLVLSMLWGCLMTIFFYPMHIGIALACGFVLFGASVVILCVSYVPRQLAKSQALIDITIVKEAAETAKNHCDDRLIPLSLEIKGYDMDVPEEAETMGPGKTLLDKMKERTALENCIAIMGDIRSLKYVKAEKEVVVEKEPEAGEDEDVYELTTYQKFVVQVKDYMRELYELLPVSRMAGYRKHSQAPFGFKDLLLELFFTGRGPFGVLGPEGMWYKLACYLKGTKNFSWVYGKWIDTYDSQGNDLRTVQLGEPIDYLTILSRNIDVDKALDHCFKEEARCAVHFLLSMLISADAKLARETVLFQKFLRENRFRLAANGIAPPRDIFSSESYASINIPLVAVWLSMLTADEQMRFHTLKATFNAEQSERDILINHSDADALATAEAIVAQHAARDEEVSQRVNLELITYREHRIHIFMESLDGSERVKFLQKRDLWCHDRDCFVDIKDTDLYNRFKTACLSEKNELVENALYRLLEIEAAQRDIRLGEYGRAYQYVDSDFPPSEFALGDGEGASYVLGWRCAPGIAPHMGLFDGGTHPDDIQEGVFKDTWLLSAISMLLAASEFGKGLINERIRFLLLPHPSPVDQELTLDTDVGVYCVRIYRNAQWMPVLVDDLLPMRKKEHWTNDNHGMAAAHCKEGKGLWLPLIEKAFAKYFGSYAALERGFVHHALSALTGCEAECLLLSSYAAGANKRTLWEQLLRYKRNGYILGAGTAEAVLADKDLQSMGICFNTAYTIYDIREVDGIKLLKLRNPPGDHEEWKGDWGDRSPLWTARLKAKCGYGDDIHDNTFFMSFDDFLAVFRYFYVCKYYNPIKWMEVTHKGFWKKSDESAVEQMDLMNQFIAEQTDGASVASSHAVDQESMDRKKAKARLNCAGGLPSRHNPACVLENNPHYSLRIHRPTDLNLTVTMDSSSVLHPFAVLVVRNDHPDVAKRLTKLTREEVVHSSGEPKAARTQSVYMSSLKPGLYVVLVAAYLSGMEGSFTVTLTSNYRNEFTPIWPPAWMLRDDKAKSKGSETPGGMSVTMSFKSMGTGKDDGMAKAGNIVRQGLKSLFGKGNEDDLEDPDGDDDDDIEKR